jgi:hypothetical protein
MTALQSFINHKLRFGLCQSGEATLVVGGAILMPESIGPYEIRVPRAKMTRGRDAFISGSRRSITSPRLTASHIQPLLDLMFSFAVIWFHQLHRTNAFALNWFGAGRGGEGSGRIHHQPTCRPDYAQPRRNQE